MAGRLTQVRPGLEILLTDSTALWQGKRVGLVTNLAAVDRSGVGAIDRLRSGGVNLVALFGPEHGLSVRAAPGEAVASTIDSLSQTPIYSLYGQNSIPTTEMLSGIELLLVDLPDVGTRYFTYLATTIDVIRGAAPLGIPVVVLDRPDPLGGIVREGNILDTLYRSKVGILALPIRHGLTLAEAALLAKQQMHLAGDLAVVPASGWQRSMTILKSGLPFVAPSPNLQDAEALFHYPGTCLFEGTNLSVGRGTDAPFKQVGAQWLDTTTVLARMRALKLPGVSFAGVAFTPHAPGDGKSADTTVAGIRLTMTDPQKYRPVTAALHLLAIIREVHSDRFSFNSSFDRLAGGPGLRDALEQGVGPDSILASWQADLGRFARDVSAFLLYR